MVNLELLSARQLLVLYGEVLEALRSRGTVRSGNNPVADYAEELCRRALGLTLTSKSTTGHDGIDPAGNKIEIKARRVTDQNGSRQLSALRGLELKHFDYLAGVLFDSKFAVLKGCLIDHEVVMRESKRTEHTNSHRFLLRDSVWSLPGVRDITDVLKAAELLS